MDESYCRCPGCGECSAHANAPKLKAEIKRLKAKCTWVGLTPEERLVIIDQWHWDEGKTDYLCRLVEEKLREKNSL